MDKAFFKYEVLAGMVLNRSRKSLIIIWELGREDMYGP